MKLINKIIRVLMVLVAVASADISHAAENHGALPKEFAQEDDTDCGGKPGDSIDISIQCYYKKLQFEIHRNKKIRELIQKALEKQAIDVEETPDVGAHFRNSHALWLAFGDITCETLVQETTGYISKYLAAEQTSCWLRAYRSYSSILLTQYGMIFSNNYHKSIQESE